MHRRTLRCSLLAAAVLAAFPAGASADSLFYVKSSDVYASRSDGSGEVRLTGDARNAWPSQADDGTWAWTANDGNIYRGGADGSLINSMTTEGSYYGGGSLPQVVRISPDGSKIAYQIYTNGSGRTLWTPSNSTNINTPNQVLGQEDYGSANWDGNSYLFLSHIGTPVTSTQPVFATYHVGDADNNLYDGGTDDKTFGAGDDVAGYHSTIARDGSKVAVVEEDGADYLDGVPRNAVLRLFSTNATVPTGVTFKCELTLPANESAENAVPSFSPDGTKVAFAEADGVHVATVGNLSSCPSSAPLVIAGATMPYWGAANPPVKPSGTTGTPGTSGTQDTSGTQGTQDTQGTTTDGGGGTDTKAPVVSLSVAGKVKLAKALAKGLPLSAGCDEPCVWSVLATIDAKTARKVGLLPKKSHSKTYTIAIGTLPAGAGTRTLLLRFSSKARKSRKLKRLKSLKLKLTERVSDLHGNGTQGKKTVTLRR